MVPTTFKNKSDSHNGYDYVSSVLDQTCKVTLPFLMILAIGTILGTFICSSSYFSDASNLHASIFSIPVNDLAHGNRLAREAVGIRDHDRLDVNSDELAIDYEKSKDWESDDPDSDDDVVDSEEDDEAQRDTELQDMTLNLAKQKELELETDRKMKANFSVNLKSAASSFIGTYDSFSICENYGDYNFSIPNTNYPCTPHHKRPSIDATKFSYSSLYHVSHSHQATTGLGRIEIIHYNCNLRFRAEEKEEVLDEAELNGNRFKQGRRYAEMVMNHFGPDYIELRLQGPTVIVNYFQYQPPNAKDHAKDTCFYWIEYQLDIPGEYELLTYVHYNNYLAIEEEYPKRSYPRPHLSLVYNTNFYQLPTSVDAPPYKYAPLFVPSVPLCFDCPFNASGWLNDLNALFGDPVQPWSSPLKRQQFFYSHAQWQKTRVGKKKSLNSSSQSSTRFIPYYSLFKDYAYFHSSSPLRYENLSLLESANSRTAGSDFPLCRANSFLAYDYHLFSETDSAASASPSATAIHGLCDKPISVVPSPPVFWFPPTSKYRGRILFWGDSQSRKLYESALIMKGDKRSVVKTDSINMLQCSADSLVCYQYFAFVSANLTRTLKHQLKRFDTIIFSFGHHHGARHDSPLRLLKSLHSMFSSLITKHHIPLSELRSRLIWWPTTFESYRTSPFHYTYEHEHRTHTRIIVYNLVASLYLESYVKLNQPSTRSITQDAVTTSESSSDLNRPTECSLQFVYASVHWFWSDCNADRSHVAASFRYPTISVIHFLAQQIQAPF